jgi:hypothetical protein
MRPIAMPDEGVVGPDDPRLFLAFYADPLAKAERELYGRQGQVGLLVGRFAEHEGRGFAVVHELVPVPMPCNTGEPLAYAIAHPEVVAAYAATLNRQRAERQQQVVGWYITGPMERVPAEVDALRRAVFRDLRFATLVVFARGVRAAVATGYGLEYLPCPHEAWFLAGGVLRRTPVLHAVPGARVPNALEQEVGRRLTRAMRLWMKCLRCGEHAPRHARTCPHCGYELVDRRVWYVRFAPNFVEAALGALIGQAAFFNVINVPWMLWAYGSPWWWVGLWVGAAGGAAIGFLAEPLGRVIFFMESTLVEGPPRWIWRPPFRDDE